MAEANLVYGISDGRPVHIRDAGRGRAFRYECPECRERLVARKGDVRAWHFAHFSGAECAAAPETAIHKMAKQFLEDRGEAFLPVLYGSWRGKPYKLRDPEHWRGCAVDTECTEFKGVVPDAYIIGPDGRKLFVEIFVTHAVDAEKLEKLKALGIPVLEADFSGVPRDVLPEDFEAAAPGIFGKAGWAYHPWREGWLDEKKAAEAAKRAASEEARKRQREAVRAAMSAAAAGKRAGAPPAPSGSELPGRTAEQERAAGERRAALDAVYAKIEADRKAREEAEAAEREAARQAMIEKAERYRAEYLAIGDAVGRLLHGPRCPACGGDIEMLYGGPDGSGPVYGGCRCGRLWEVDGAKAGFVLSGRHICPSCGRPMAEREGRYGKFWGCTGYPACRRTARM